MMKLSKKYKTIYRPNDADRNNVKMLVFSGISLFCIAKMMKISENTLRKYYAEEIEHGRAMLVSTVSKLLFDKALKGDTSAMIFILSRKGRDFGWGNENKIETESVTPAVITLPVVLPENSWSRVTVPMVLDEQNKNTSTRLEFCSN